MEIGEEAAIEGAGFAGQGVAIDNVYRAIEIIDFLYRAKWPKYLSAYAGNLPASTSRDAVGAD